MSRLVILAGPNGAGKTASAAALLRGPLAVDEFVNADTIASGLSAFDPNSVAIEAGRIMLARIKQLANRGANVAFETTLASRSFAPWLRTFRHYEIHLIFLWLPTPEAAVERVR
jgi:predicted ABC-type ATPase